MPTKYLGQGRFFLLCQPNFVEAAKKWEKSTTYCAKKPQKGIFVPVENTKIYCQLKAI